MPTRTQSEVSSYSVERDSVTFHDERYLLRPVAPPTTAATTTGEVPNGAAVVAAAATRPPSGMPAVQKDGSMQFDKTDTDNPNGQCRFQQLWWEGDINPFTKMAQSQMADPIFADLSENQFMAKEVVARVNDHPDAMLRMTGLIQQSGVRRVRLVTSEAVVYDEALQTWVQKESRAIRTISKNEVTERVDVVPLGLISVVGTFDLNQTTVKGPAWAAKNNNNNNTAAVSSPLLAEANNSGTMAELTSGGGGGGHPQWDGERLSPSGAHGASPAASQGAVRTVHTAHTPQDGCGYDVRPTDRDDDDEQMIMVIGDPDAEFLSDAEVRKFHKHYLTRCVVQAARSSGSSILVSGVDDLTRQIGIGYDAFIDPYCIRNRKESVETKVIGLNPRSRAHEVSLSLSQNILFESSGGHEFDGQDDTSECVHCGVSLVKYAMTKVDHTGSLTPAEMLEREFCSAHPDYKRLYEVRERAGLTTHQPTERELLKYKQRMLEVLNQGYQRRQVRGGNEEDQPPNRDPVPVVLVVFGGDETTKKECHYAVARGWPLLIMEGSGGFADVICKTIRKVNALSPEAGADEFRLLLGGVDAVTSEIINNGSHQLIPPGTPVSHVQRLINSALKGDEILHQAWKLYSLWHANQRWWYVHYQTSQMTVLLLGIAATFAAVLQTFLILLFAQSDTSEIAFTDRWSRGSVRASEKTYYMLYRLLQWLIIGLPITLTLMHAIFQRMNPWAKLAALRIAASMLLREIYAYRTRTWGYSSEATKRNKKDLGNAVASSMAGTQRAKGMLRAAEMEANISKAGGGVAAGGPSDHSAKDADGDGEVGGANSAAMTVTGSLDVYTKMSYSTREELLGIMMIRIQTQFNLSEAGAITLRNSLDGVPPSSITSTGDTGLSFLTPDDYVKFRLSTSRQNHSTRARQLDRRQTFFSVCVVLFGGIGTILAALTAYGLGYLQPWVAFATVLVNSLSRFLDFIRIGAMAELCNTTTHRLSDVERWWSSLGTEADSDKNRTKLVTDTERILQDELDGWSKQMAAMVEDTMKSGNEGDETTEAADKAAKEAEERKAMGTDLLQQETIVSALSDPNGAASQSIKKQILDLNDQLGGVVVVKKNQQAATDGAEGGERAATATESVSDNRLSFTTNKLREASVIVAPSDRILSTVAARTLLADDLVQRKFFLLFSKFMIGMQAQPILDYLSFTAYTLRQGLRECTAQSGDDLISTLNDDQLLLLIRSFCVKNMMQHLPAVWGTESVSFGDEEFLASLATVCMTFRSCMATVGKEILSRMIESTAVKNAILTLPTAKLKTLLQAAVEIFSVSENTSHIGSTAAKSIYFAVYRTVCRLLAHQTLRAVQAQCPEMHQDMLLVMETCNQIPMLEISRKMEILKLFPPSLHSGWESITGLQLIELTRVLALGTAASRALTRCHALIRHEVSERTWEWLQNPSHREVFATACNYLNQVMIYKLHKGEVLRAMQSASSMTKEFANGLAEVMSEVELKSTLSSLQAAYSNCYAASMLQRIGDAFVLLDFRELVDADGAEDVVNTFASSISFPRESGAELVAQVPVASAQRFFSILAEEQITALFQTSRRSLCLNYFGGVWRSVVGMSGNRNQARMGIIERLYPYAAARLIYRVMFMRRTEVLDIGDSYTLSKAIAQIDDPSVTEALIGACHESRMEFAYATQFAQLVEDIHIKTRDQCEERGEVLEETRDPILVRLTKLAQSACRASMSGFLTSYFRLTDCSLATESFLSLLELHIDEVYQWSAMSQFVEGLKMGPTNSPPHFETAYSDSLVELRDTVIETCILFEVEFPYAVFENICQWCQSFDLRDLVVDRIDRQTFPMSLHAFLMSGTEAVALLSASNEVTKLEVLRVVNDALAENPMVALTAKVTRMLGETHLRRFLRVVGHFFQFTQAGVAFDTFCRVRNERYMNANPDDVSLTTLSIPPSRSKEVSQLLRSIDVLASYLIALTRGMKMVDVQEIFCSFNPKSFVSQLHLRGDGVKTHFSNESADEDLAGGPTGRVEWLGDRLRAMIPNDSVVDVLFSLSPQNVEKLFMIMRSWHEMEHRFVLRDASTMNLLLRAHRDMSRRITRKERAGEEDSSDFSAASGADDL